MSDKRYAALFLAVFLSFGLLVWLPAALLWRSGETWPMSWIVSYQMKHDAIWSHGLLDRELSYKRTLYSAVKPEIIALGTSRVLQLRQDMFHGQFLNMGRGIDTLSIGREIENLLKFHRPKVVVWGIDYWTVSKKARQESEDWHTTAGLVSGLSLEGRILPELVPKVTLNVWSLIRTGVVPLDSAWWTLVNGTAHEGPRLGLRAATVNKGGGGYLSDGSYAYFDAFRFPIRTAKILRNQLENYKQTNTMYAMRESDEISATALAQITSVLRLLKERGIDVIVYTPPLPKEHLNVAQNNDQIKLFLQEFSDSMARICLDSSAEFFDLLDPTGSNILTSEFVDAIHPGEVANAKILMQLSDRGSGIERILNKKRLRRIISDFSGQSTIDREFYSRFGVLRSDTLAEPVSPYRIRAINEDTIRVDRPKPDIKLQGINTPKTNWANSEVERTLGSIAP